MRFVNAPASRRSRVARRAASLREDGTRFWCAQVERLNKTSHRRLRRTREDGVKRYPDPDADHGPIQLQGV